MGINKGQLLMLLRVSFEHSGYVCKRAVFASLRRPFDIIISIVDVPI